ncbi:hypothetical protein DPMN_019578 [Dreissena polymorpha]|uniref:Uncharacterized protein n=1 Tax=Dreissena polymorpha TaxID=45954 RepID=A0A9D4NL31_DREPO|nr:hypothetical protein DPMN_019578 [Dreissena polymorpha]
MASTTSDSPYGGHTCFTNSPCYDNDGDGNNSYDDGDNVNNKYDDNEEEENDNDEAADDRAFLPYITDAEYRRLPPPN